MAAAAASLGVAVTLVWFDAALEAWSPGGSKEAADAARAPAACSRGARDRAAALLACSASAVQPRASASRPCCRAGRRHRGMADGRSR